MKVIKDGYSYGLRNKENPQLKGQTIQFVEQEIEGKLHKTLTNGTTLDELLEVALAKATFDNNPASRAKAMVATKIEEAILWLERSRKTSQ